MTLGSLAGEAKLLGGRLCLDFANSVGARVSGPHARGSRNYLDEVRREKLETYADLIAWSRHVGLVSQNDQRKLLKLSESHPLNAHAVLRRSIALREAIYRIFKSAVEGWNPNVRDLGVLNDELSVARLHERVVPTADGFGWAWSEGNGELDRMLWPIARSAAELVTSGDLSKVRQCGGEECGWLFLDNSRNRSRQWCSMVDCGNLAKVRRFRSRRHVG
jgi:predicted RNA-binding Zn ribbon-like protein